MTVEHQSVYNYVKHKSREALHLTDRSKRRPYIRGSWFKTSHLRSPFAICLRDSVPAALRLFPGYGHLEICDILFSKSIQLASEVKFKKSTFDNHH